MGLADRSVVTASMAQERGVLGLGIIGCGYAAEHLHLPALRSLASVRAVAIADTDAERLRLVGDRFGIDRRYNGHEALLRDSGVDAVAVCVPPDAHAAVVLAALDARKHVFVEKPLCLDPNDADRLIQRARRTSVTAMVGFNLRYHRHVRRAREAIARGLVGHVDLVRTVWSSQVVRHAGLPEWRRRRELGGGVLHELGTHHVDLWRFLLNSEVEEVFALTGGENNDDETVTLTARLRNGALAVSGFSQCAAEAHDIEVYGRQGRLLASPYRFDGFELAPASSFPGDVKSRARDLRRTLRALPDAISSSLRGGSFLESYRAEWRHFVSGALSGTPTDSTFEDGRRALELVLAAVESSRTGRPVDIDEPRPLTEGALDPGA